MAISYELPLTKARPFLIDPEEGMLINPADHSKHPRNIALKITTFLSLLKGIKAAFDSGNDHILHDKDKDKDKDLKTIFKEVGYSPGFTFGIQMEEELKERYKELEMIPPYKLIEGWFQFDRDAGFGHFIYDGFKASNFLKGDISENPDSKKIKIGTITLKNNFLLEPDENGNIDVNMVYLIAGYIEGVINVLFVKNELRNNHRKSDTIIFELGNDISSSRDSRALFRFSNQSMNRLENESIYKKNKKIFSEIHEKLKNQHRE